MRIPDWLGRILVSLGSTRVNYAPAGRVDPASGELHLDLLESYRDGRPMRDPVHAADLGRGRFRLLHSPGFVQGIAAGDEFEVLGPDGAFRVVHRGGNLAVQVFGRETFPPEMAAETARRVAGELGGTLDGRIERGMVFTVPVAAGFPAIERFFGELEAATPGLEWVFGNVYDPDDGVTPLNWWVAAGPPPDADASPGL